MGWGSLRSRAHQMDLNADTAPERNSGTRLRRLI